MIRYAPEGPHEPLPLYLPQGLWERLTCLLSGRGAEEFAEAFIPVTIHARERFDFGGLSVVPHSVEHTDPTFAFVLEADGVRVCYTADTAPCDGVYPAAEGVDLLLAEATLPDAFAGKAPHLTAAQAGEIARASGVRALVLTHVWYTNDRSRIEAEASAAFGGPVRVASEFDCFNISPTSGGDD
jgi:ribonuclease BN (tRNA processing enzyme)